MLTLTVEDIELYDNASGNFVDVEGGTFRFEHSLESVADWEARWQHPFLNSQLTNAQLNDYYRAMCLDEGFTSVHITPKVAEALSAYMNDKQTATTIQNDDNSPSSSKIMTSEVIYSLMVAGQVPFECARWNLNRLMVLLRVISINQSPPKKMTREEVLQQNAKLNAERKQKYDTKG